MAEIEVPIFHKEKCYEEVRSPYNCLNVRRQCVCHAAWPWSSKGKLKHSTSDKAFAEARVAEIVPAPQEGADCCVVFVPELFQAKAYFWDSGQQTLGFEATGVGPFSNEGDPVVYSVGDPFLFVWNANAYNMPVYKVRVETFAYQPDGSATVVSYETFGADYFDVDCDSGLNMTYGRAASGLHLTPGSFEKRYTAWPCDGGAPQTISLFYEVVE